MKNFVFTLFLLPISSFANVLYCEGYYRDYKYDQQGKVLVGQHLDSDLSFQIKINKKKNKIIDNNQEYKITSNETMYLYHDERYMFNLDRVTGEYIKFPRPGTRGHMIKAKCELAKIKF